MKNIIIVHRPELSEAERARRMEQIKEAAARLIVAADTNKQEKEASTCQQEASRIFRTTP